MFLDITDTDRGIPPAGHQLTTFYTSDEIVETHVTFSLPLGAGVDVLVLIGDALEWSMWWVSTTSSMELPAVIDEVLAALYRSSQYTVRRPPKRAYYPRKPYFASRRDRGRGHRTSLPSSAFYAS